MVPLIYHINNCGVVTNPTPVFEILPTKGKSIMQNTARITIGSADGYWWAVGVQIYLSDRGYSSPCSWFIDFSREHATIRGCADILEWLNRDLKRNDTLKSSAPFINKVIKELTEFGDSLDTNFFGIKMQEQMKCATLITLL